MECLIGESLADRLTAKGHLPIEEAVPIFLQVCKGLSLAHSKGIIHRDLKPANIFLAKGPSADGKSDIVKIVDFGMAGLVSQSVDGQKLTSTGNIFGSPLYMSPEQSMGRPVSGRSDIYSCGCALYETLTGSPPFRGENAFATMMQHQQAQVPALVSKPGEREFPRRLIALLARMLAKDEEDRFESFDQIADELKLILNGHKLRQIEGPKGAPPSVVARGKSTEPVSDATSTAPRTLLFSSLLVSLVLVIGALSAYFVFGALPGAKPAQPPVPVAEKLEVVPPYLQKANPLRPGWRYYKFPNQVLGKLAWTLPRDAPTQIPCILDWPVKGSLEVPPDARMFLTALKAPAQDPKLLSGFGPDDLSELALDNDYKTIWNKKHIAYISKMTGLSVLNIDHVRVGDEVIDDLDHLSSLKRLTIRDTSITGPGVARLQRLPQFTALMLAGTENVFAALAALKGSKNMEVLKLEHCKLNADDIKVIATMTNLKTLNLYDNPLLHDKDLKPLSNLKKLELLSLADTSASIGCIETLEKLPFLTHVYENWEDKDLAKIRAQMPKCVWEYGGEKFNNPLNLKRAFAPGGVRQINDVMGTSN